MRYLIAILASFFVLVSSGYSVTWHVVSLSVVVKQGGDDIESTVLSSRSYIKFMADRFATPKDDLFVGFNAATGAIAVVRRSDETILYNIVSGVGGGGTAANGANTKGTISATAVVSSLNTDFQGFVYDSYKRDSTGGIKKLSRTFLGGGGNQTIRGTATTTGKKIEL